MRSWTVYLRTIICLTACLILAVDEVCAVTITLTPTGTPGAVYGDSDFTNDVAYDSAWFSGVAGRLNNQDTGATDPFVVAADGSGITQPASTVNWWENANVWDSNNQAPRTAFYFDIREAAAGAAFTLDSVDVTVGGVAGNGIRMRLIYRTGGSIADLHSIDFNGGANVSDGTYSIDLSAAGLHWTDHSTPLLDGDWFRVGFYDPSTGNDTSGTAVIEKVEIKALASPLLEFEAGTDQVVLHLRGDNGMAYAVRRTPDLVDGSWSHIAFGNLSTDWMGVTNSTAGIPQAFYQAAALVNTHYLGGFDGFYRNRRVLDVKLDNAAHKIIVPDWLCDTNTLDFPYERKDNPLVASDGKEMFLADNLVLVRVLGGWVTNSANPTIADVKQNDLFYLDGNDQAAYRWNLLDKRVDPLIDRGYGCSNITLVLDNIPYDLVAPSNVVVEKYGQVGIPQDFAQWGEFIRQLCLHLESKYGLSANGFRFRLGTESQSAERFRGTEEDYFKYYDHAEHAVKSVLPDALIGPFNRAQVGDPPDDTISMERLAEHCAFGTNYASGVVGGGTFDWVAHSFYFLGGLIHPDGFVPELEDFYNDVRAVDGRYSNIPLEIPEFGPILTEGGLLSTERGVLGAAKIMETLVDLKTIGMTRTALWTQEETLGQLEGRILFSGIEWLYCIFDHMRGGQSWKLPVEIVGGSPSNSVETLASVQDDVAYVLVSCWNTNRKATAGSTVEVTLPAEVWAFSTNSVEIKQILFQEANSVYDVIWEDFRTNNLLSSANLDHFYNYGKTVSWATTGNGMAADDPTGAATYVIDHWLRYQTLMSDALTLKPFTGTIQTHSDGGKALRLEMPIPSVYVISIKENQGS